MQYANKIMGKPDAVRYMVFAVEKDNQLAHVITTTKQSDAILTQNYLREHGEQTKLLTVIDYLA